MKELITVDYELINRLKREGRFAEAREHLKEFRRTVREEKKNIFSNMQSQYNKVRKIYLDKTNLCHYCCKKIRTQGRYCKDCYEKVREYSLRYGCKIKHLISPAHYRICDFQLHFTTVVNKNGDIIDYKFFDR